MHFEKKGIKSPFKMNEIVFFHQFILFLNVLIVFVLWNVIAVVETPSLKAILKIWFCKSEYQALKQKVFVSQLI